MSNVVFINTRYYPNDEERERLDKIQDAINSCRARIQNEVHKNPNAQYWFMMRVEKLAQDFRARIKLAPDPMPKGIIRPRESVSQQN